MKHPSVNQILLARNISSKLHIKLPKEKSQDAYEKFIHAYINKYKRELQKYN